LAVDIGASGGRAILCSIKDNKFILDDIHRFTNEPVLANGLLYWNFPSLFEDIKLGIRKAAEIVDFESLGIDTWGVDFAMVSHSGEIIEGPVSYRDGRTGGVPDELHKTVGSAEFYIRTGNQQMAINTVYQLAALRKVRPDLFALLDYNVLMMPDLFNYALTGKAAAELSIASTTQLLNPQLRDWDYELMDLLGYPRAWFPPIVNPGSVLGGLRPELCSEISVSRDIKVINTCGHDTACAAAAAPFEERSLFLSSGTWMLIGAMLDEPVLTAESAAAELSNEVGFGGKIRYLKNITGTWLLQQSAEELRLSFQEMEKLAKEATTCLNYIDPDAREFQSPGEMLAKIGAAIGNNELKTVLRCIYDSLAMKVRYSAAQIEKNTGNVFININMVGGGTQSALLCQTIADITQRTVYAGPVEATAMGNAIVQFIANGYISSIAEAREMVRNSVKITVYKPAISASAADTAYISFLKSTNLGR